jgi:hypothetical protein
MIDEVKIIYSYTHIYTHMGFTMNASFFKY